MKYIFKEIGSRFTHQAIYFDQIIFFIKKYNVYLESINTYLDNFWASTHHFEIDKLSFVAAELIS